MSRDLGGVSSTIALSKDTHVNIKLNLFWALACKLAFIRVAAGVLYPFNGTLLWVEFAVSAMALCRVFVGNYALRL
ncbi:hypothetical protein N5E15_21750 [Pantoea stewartii]|uniref:hypothetical protein n=1 Tax=Pantoea stewartii TaxID=66269 RepID=UPI0021D4DD92|nr:hypothetical protein [Pantoea stewartii]MCU7369203.1 hypothetical protein [Pantoea stewartii]